MIDYYKILEIPEDASQQDIKSAFRSKAKTCHPDVSGSEESSEAFMQIEEAFRILSDPARKSGYDGRLEGHKVLEKIRKQTAKEHAAEYKRNPDLSANIRYANSRKRVEHFERTMEARHKRIIYMMQARKPVLIFANLLILSGFAGCSFSVALIISTIYFHDPGQLLPSIPMGIIATLLLFYGRLLNRRETDH